MQINTEETGDVQITKTLLHIFTTYGKYFTNTFFLSMRNLNCIVTPA